jgi:hypothetical protein
MEQLGVGVIEFAPATGKSRLFPSPGLRLSPGDHVLVQGTFETMANLRGRVVAR